MLSVVGLLGACGFVVQGTAPAAQAALATPSGAGSVRTLAQRQVSLYSTSSLWRGYLASERTCKGGERTDLPPASQASTLACLVNWARARRGLRPLAVVAVLNHAARTKAEAIVRCHAFEHDPCGGGAFANVRAAGYAGAAGENLYMAQGRWGAPRVVLDGWLNSPAHRHTLFGRAWRTQGFALATQPDAAGDGRVAVWVSVFGDR